MAEGFKIADAFVEIHADKDPLKRELRTLGSEVGGDAEVGGTDVGRRAGKGVQKGIGPESDKAGRDSGSKVAKGFQQSFIRNSPLIVAAIGGALAAGAPVALAGAATLFAGVGAALAAQSPKVQSAWVGLWQNLISEGRADASVLEDTVTRAAGRIGESFERLRPQIREAFEASGPLIDSFVDDVTGAAENAVPGLVDAVKNAGPAVTGLGEFLRSTGQGVGDFFSILSEHAPQAGQAFKALGDIIASLLPILGELLGRGADLAAVVLPPLASILKVVAGALDAIGPALGPLIAGFTALKIVKGVTGSFTEFAEKGFGGLLGKIPGVNSGLGKVGEAVKGMGAALPLVGVAIGLVVSEIENINQKGAELSQKLREGGAAAREAKAELADLGNTMGGLGQEVADSGLPDWFVKLGAVTGGVTAPAYEAAGSIRETAKQADEAWKSMDRLSQANSKVAEWTATLTDRLGDENATSADVEAAKRRLAYWSDEQARAEADLEMAIHGVTQAMIEQADQALASIDSGFAYQHSLNQLEDAQSALADAIAKHGANSEEAARAQLDLEEQTFRTAQAFGQQQADLSGAAKDSEEYARILQEQTLVRLKELAATADGPVKAALEAQIARLEAAGVSTTSNAATVVALTNRLQDLGLAVTQVPGEKFVRVDVPTEEQKQRLRDLGYTVTELPDGDIFVSADTASAERAIDAAARQRTATINVVYRGTTAGVIGGANSYAAAAGGIFAATGYASGGIEKMSGKRAAIVPPRSPRIIGDRLTNDEGFVPIVPSDPQAQGILSEVNRRMGRGDGQGGGTRISIGNLTVKIDGTFDLSSARDLKRMAAMIRQAIIDLEREAS